MPKFQTRAARVARQIQAASGVKYTTILRLFAPAQEELVLADAMRTAGLTTAADSLTRIALVLAERGMWVGAYAHIENEFIDTDPTKVKKARAVCLEAGNAVMRREGFLEAGFEPGAEIYHAAFLALSRAGAVPDGRCLARAAVGVFDSDPLMCSDVIRSEGRSPFTYESADKLIGPDTPAAVAARKAARAMAAASRVQEHGDEEWYEAAELMVGAAWHGSVAAELPPLHGLTEFQDFFETVMERVLDVGP